MPNGTGNASATVLKQCKCKVASWALASGEARMPPSMVPILYPIWGYASQYAFVGKNVAPDKNISAIARV